MKAPVALEVGDYIHVKVYSPNHKLPELFPNATSSVTYDGFVVASEAYDPKNSFRITGSKQMPVRVIAWENVLAFNDEPIENNKAPKPSSGVFRTIIEGSKGARYNVEIDEKGNAKCDCKGYGFRGYCKHCDAARELLAQQTK